MWNFNLLNATQSVEKTMGFVLYRWLVLLAVAGGLLLATLAGAGTAIGVSSLSTNPTLFANAGAILGFVVFGWLLYRFRKELYYNVTASHQLLLAKIARGESIPQGKAQVAFAKQSVNERFPDLAEFWQIKTSSAEALSALPGYVVPRLNVSNPLLAKLVGWMSDRLSRLNIDVVVASLLVHRGLAPWALVRDEILTLAGNARILLKNRLVLVVVGSLGWLIAYVVLLIPAQKIAGSLPFETGYWPYVFAWVFSWNIKASFLEPIIQAAMIQLHNELPRAETDSQLAAGLMERSEAFRQICARSEEEKLRS